MKDKSHINLGWFDSITQVWELHPEGGHEGEYFYVDSQKYRWNKTTRNWEYAATDPVAGGNFTVGNDFAVNNNALVGNDLRVRGNAKVEKNLFVGGKIFAKGVKQPNLGFFPSEEALKAAHPTPEVGMWASVGTTMPGTVWRCEVAGVWVNTEQEGGVDPTDVNYGIVNNLESESTTEALSAAMGAKLQDEKLGVVPQGLTEDQKMQAQANMGLDKIIDGLRKRTGYFVCSTPYNSANKVVSAPNFELSPGCCIKIKMLYHNEALNPTLNINNTGQRLLHFAKVIASKDNTWLDGEVIEVYYDGEFYFANSIDGGATFKSGERVRDILIEDEPKRNSKNLVTSGGVFNRLAQQDEKIKDAISDMNESIERQEKEIGRFEEAVRDQVDNYKPIVINGDVTNAPDEEDITSVEGLLKFKNRSALFGKGFIILRRGLSFSEQVTNRNTVYEIKYDFDLDGEEVTMPEGCLLVFNGGQLSNGTIISDNTMMDNINISSNLTIFGRIYNAEGKEISRYGDVIEHNCKLYGNYVHWWGIKRTFQSLYKLGITRAVNILGYRYYNGGFVLDSNKMSSFVSIEDDCEKILKYHLDIPYIKFHIDEGENFLQSPYSTSTYVEASMNLVKDVLAEYAEHGVTFKKVWVVNEHDPVTVRMSSDVRSYWADPIDDITYHISTTYDAETWIAVRCPAVAFAGDKIANISTNYYPMMSAYPAKFSNSQNVEYLKDQMDFYVRSCPNNSSYIITEVGTHGKIGSLIKPSADYSAEVDFYEVDTFYQMMVDAINMSGGINEICIWYLGVFDIDECRESAYKHLLKLR